jgi:hypothetical protein
MVLRAEHSGEGLHDSAEFLLSSAVVSPVAQDDAEVAAAVQRV